MPNGYVNSNYYKHGEWNAYCDVCGFKFKSGQMRKRWDGMMVCDKDWEQDHPQKYLKVREDKQSVPWVRVEGTSLYVTLAPVVDFTASVTEGYAPLTVAFSDLTRPIPLSTWDWDMGSSLTSTSQNPTVVYATPGTFTVSLEVVNTDGITGTETKAAYINVITPYMTAAFTADVTSGDGPLTVNLTDLSKLNPTSWSWDFGDSTTTTLQNPSHTYTTVGMYTVTLTADNGYNTDDVSEIIYVNGPIPATAVKLQYYFDESSGNPVDYSISKAISPGLSYQTDTTYKVLQQNTVPGPFDDYSISLNPGTTHTTATISNLTVGGGTSYTGTAASMFLATGDFSVEFWYRLSSSDAFGDRGGWIMNHSGYGAAFTGGTVGSERARGRWSVWVNNNGSYVWSQGTRGGTDPGTHQQLTSSSSTVDTWHHGCVERQGTTLRYWLDGVLQDEAAQVTAPDSTTSDNLFVIGSIWNQATPRGTSGNFIGYLGGIRITVGYVRNGGSYNARWPVPA